MLASLLKTLQQAPWFPTALGEYGICSTRFGTLVVNLFVSGTVGVGLLYGSFSFIFLFSSFPMSRD